MRKIIYICLFAVVVMLIIQACNEDKSNVTKQENQQYLILNEPYWDSFSAIVGFLTANEGPLLNIYDRALITYPTGKVDYYVAYTRIDNSVGSISFKIVDVVNNTPYIVANPSYWICDQAGELCFWGCQLDRPTESDPSYSCYCKDSGGPGNNACSLIDMPGPEEPLHLYDYTNAGRNILNTLAFSGLVSVNL